MYKILIKKEATSRLDEVSWVVLLNEDETEFEAATIPELQEKLKKVLCTVPKNSVRAVSDVSYVLDVIVEEEAVTE